MGVMSTPRAGAGHRADNRLPRPLSFFSCHNRWDLKPCVPVADRIEPYQGLDTLLRRLGRCQLVISERLHGAVLAHAVGTPAVQIVSERKCVDYMPRSGAVTCAFGRGKSKACPAPAPSPAGTSKRYPPGFRRNGCCFSKRQIVY